MPYADHCWSGLGYASPEEAMKTDRDKILYAAALYTGSGIEEPDYLATIDVDPESPTYSQIIHRTPMPNVGDELHTSAGMSVAPAKAIRASRAGF